MSAIKKTFAFGQHQVTLETGELARQADGAVVVTMGDTVVLVTAVARKEADPNKDFFPLTVNYVEKTYAAGRIPGGFFKREGRPSEKETLTSRLIDRPIRPLFPEGFFNEVQVVATVSRSIPTSTADIPALLGASAALALSGVPFQGPIGAAKVGYNDGQYMSESDQYAAQDSKLDLVVAGTAEAVLMVESEADCLPEDVMLGAVVFGHEQMQVAIKAINELKAEARQAAWNWQPAAANAPLEAALASHAEAALADAYKIIEKQARRDRIQEIKEAALLALAGGDARVRRRRRREGIRQPRISHRAPPRDRRRAAHRRPRHEDGASDHDPHRRAAAHARLGAVHARRDAGAGRHDARHRPRRADHRCARAASAKSRSCCTTTSRRSASARRA